MSEENTEPENLPENEAAAELPPMPELEEFIFKPDEFRDKIVPRKLVAANVAKFLIQKINKDTKLEAFIQVEQAADFYDTTEIVEKYRSFLDKTESGSEEVRRSIVIARIIAVLGTAEDVEFAKQYYKYLITKIDTIGDFEEIIFLHEDLGLGTDSNALRQKIKEKTKALESKSQSDYSARLQYLKFQETIDQKLTAAEQVQSVKDKILRNTDRRKRLEEEIKMYVTTDYGFPQFLQQWSPRRIRRETWAVAPAEQIKRNDKLPLKGDVVKSLRLVLEKVNELPNLDDEEKEAVKLRLLRAIKFFDGQLSTVEEGVLRHYRAEQVDVLANEGFQIK